MKKHEILKTTYTDDSQSKNNYDGNYGPSYRGILIVEGEKVTGISIQKNPESPVESLKDTISYVRLKDLARDAGKLRAELAVMDSILNKASELKLH